MDLDLRHRHGAHAAVKPVRRGQGGTDDDLELAQAAGGKEQLQPGVEVFGDAPLPPASSRQAIDILLLSR